MVFRHSKRPLGNLFHNPGWQNRANCCNVSLQCFKKCKLENTAQDVFDRMTYDLVYAQFFYSFKILPLDSLKVHTSPFWQNVDNT